MTTHRTTFTLEPDAHAFLAQIAGENKSAYINTLLKREKQRSLEEALLAANHEESEDQEYQRDLADWDVALSDGLHD